MHRSKHTSKFVFIYILKKDNLAVLLPYNIWLSFVAFEAQISELLRHTDPSGRFRNNPLM